MVRFFSCRLRGIVMQFSAVGISAGIPGAGSMLIATVGCMVLSITLVSVAWEPKFTAINWYGCSIIFCFSFLPKKLFSAGTFKAVCVACLGDTHINMRQRCCLILLVARSGRGLSHVGLIDAHFSLYLPRAAADLNRIC